MLQNALAATDLKPQFSGHETFPVRYGWLKKVVDAINETPSIERSKVFDPDLAMANFGVGKNMVVSMRHWAIAAGLIDYEPKTRTNVTPLGELILSEDGLDPYLEQHGTLWLIHWKLASTPERTTTWYWAFNHFSGALVSREALLSDITRLVQEHRLTRLSPATLHRDVDCFFRTYLVNHTKNGEITEDSLECPLAELELITPTANKGVYKFNQGPKPSLPDEVFGFALAEFWQRRDAETLSVESVTYDAGSPGRTFKLDEQSVSERLMRIEDVSNGAFRWSDSAGLQQVVRLKPDFNALDFLRLH